jgi:hypothetical protein
MKRDQALQVFETLRELLSPVCTRLEPAGSLRRGTKEELSEIDILAIPDLTPPPLPRAVFGKPVPKVYPTKIEALIADLALRGEIILTASGPRQKKFFYIPAAIKIDLYLCRPPATWGVLQLIRTGPELFGHWVVTRERYGGALLDDYRVQGGAVYHGAQKTKSLEGLEPIGFDTEIGFLFFLGLPWIEPKDRAPRWGERSRPSPEAEEEYL